MTENTTKAELLQVTPEMQGAFGGLAKRLSAMANGLRGSMWANRNEIIGLLDEAADALSPDQTGQLAEAHPEREGVG